MPNKQKQSIQFPVAPYSASEIQKRHEAGYGKAIMECSLHMHGRKAKHQDIVISVDKKRTALIWDLGSEVVVFFIDRRKKPHLRESWKSYKEPFKKVALNIRGLIDNHKLKLVA